MSCLVSLYEYKNHCKYVFSTYLSPWSVILHFSLLGDDYWKGEDDYWGPDPSPSEPQPDSLDPDSSYDYLKPEEEDPAAPVTDSYDDYWREYSTSPPAVYDDFWKQNTPVTDNYDSYWKEEDPTPAAPDAGGRTGTDDRDYWDATCTFDSFVLLGFVWTECVWGWQFMKHDSDEKGL